MKFGRISISMLAVLLALICFAPAGYANLLAPGGSGAPDLLTEGGTPVTGILSTPISTGTYKGTLESQVFVEAGGTLDFLYLLSVASGPDAVNRLTVTDFTGWTTDVGYLAGSGIVPTSVDRSNSGGTVGFQFGSEPNGVTAGESTDVLIIETNAKTFTVGTGSTIDGTVFSGGAYAPSPEPASVGLLLGGLFGIGLIVTRKFQARLS
jgi:hypothetical protein